jgi:O-antigen ligase
MHSSMSTLAAPGPIRLRRRVLGLSPLEWATLAASLMLAASVGALMARGQVEAAMAIAVGIPLAIVVAHSPTTGLLLWLAVTPFFVQGGASDSTSASPMTWLLFRLGIPAILALVLVYWALGTRRLKLRVSVTDLLLVGFLVFGVGSAILLTPNPQRMTMAFYSKLAVPILLFWLVRAIGFTENQFKQLILVAALTIGVQSTIGIASWVLPEVVPSQWLGRGGERTTGTFGGPGPFSVTIVLFSLLLVQSLLHEGRPGVRRAIQGGLVILGVAVVLLTLSRGSWLGAGVAFLGVGLMYPTLLFRLVLGSTVVGAILALTILSAPFAAIQDRVDDAATVDDRLITNQAALRMIGDRPAVGFGFGNFERFDEAYKSRVGDIPLKVGGSAHNTYLNFAAEMGLVGFALYFAAPAALMARTVRLWGRLPRDGLFGRRLILLLWLAILDQFIVSNFLEMVHGNTWGTLMWWFTLGLIATLLERHARSLDRPRRWSFIARAGDT